MYRTRMLTDLEQLPDVDDLVDAVVVAVAVAVAAIVVDDDGLVQVEQRVQLLPGRVALTPRLLCQAKCV